MNCNKVSHLLSAYMDGELLGYEHRLIHQHIQQCSACRAEYEDLLQMKRLLAAMRVCEPCKGLAASIVKRVSERDDEVAIRGLGLWSGALPALCRRPLVYSPVLGLGLGLAFFGMVCFARPASPRGIGSSARGQLVFEPVDTARDERPLHVDELTNGLTRESAQQTVSFEPRYTQDLPDFPYASHPAPQMRRSVFSPTQYR